MRIICERLNGHWSAWVEGRPEVACSGRTHRGAIHRLVGEIPEISLSQIKRARDETCTDRIVLYCRQPCPECRGTGKYVGLQTIERCGSCGGVGSVDECKR